MPQTDPTPTYLPHGALSLPVIVIKPAGSVRKPSVSKRKNRKTRKAARKAARKASRKSRRRD